MKSFIGRLFEKFFVDVVRYRETEPRAFRIFKYIIIYAIYIGCLGYIVILAQEIASENPHVQVSTEDQPFLPVPGFFLVGPDNFSFTVNCSYVDWTYNRKDTVNGTSCNSLLFNDQNLSIFNGTINGTINLSDNDIIGLDFQVFANNVSALSDNEPIDNTDIKIYLYDAAFPFNNDTTSSTNSDALLKQEEILLQNAYFLSQNQRNIIWYERVKYKDLDGHKLRNSAGVFAKTNDYFALETRIQAVNPHNASNLPYTAFEVYYQSRIMIVNEQIKDKTALSLLSSLGGAFGLGMAVYAFFFGREQIDPWGLSVEFPGIRGALRKRVVQSFRDTVPLSSRKYPEEIKNLSPDNAIALKIAFDHIDELRKKNHVLEVLLREYVIDVKDVAELMEGESDTGNYIQDLDEKDVNA